jgi:type II secretory pathway pseudopilin PulG
MFRPCGWSLFRRQVNRFDRGRPTAGSSLVELVVVVALIGLLVGIAVPRLRAATDRAAVRAAEQDASTFFGYARRLAVTRRTSVAVLLDTTRGLLVAHSRGETLATRPLGPRYGVRLRATRDSMAFDARGLGFGAANLSMVVERGGNVETLFVSRLGRIRR